jgi:putative heme-binding domain-containing protein
LKKCGAGSGDSKSLGAYRESSEIKAGIEENTSESIALADRRAGRRLARPRGVCQSLPAMPHALWRGRQSRPRYHRLQPRGDTDYVLQNILDPNAVIPNEYRAWNLETKDGRSITGIVKQQDDKAVTIASATEASSFREMKSLRCSRASFP